MTDTVGCATPHTIKYLFSHMRKLVSTPFSAHLHNDFGLGLINAITAINSGATHVCTTINGWGERAGNVPLEQLVISLKILYEKDLGIDTTKLWEVSEELTGVKFNLNKKKSELTAKLNQLNLNLKRRI